MASKVVGKWDELGQEARVKLVSNRVFQAFGTFFVMEPSNVMFFYLV